MLQKLTADEMPGCTVLLTILTRLTLTSCDKQTPAVHSCVTQRTSADKHTTQATRKCSENSYHCNAGVKYSI